MTTNEITTEDLFCIANFHNYRRIFNDSEIREKADDLFEQTKDLKKVDEFCKSELEKKKINPLILQSEIGIRYQNCRFSNFIAKTDTQKKIKKQAEDYVNFYLKNPNTGKNLILAGYGNVGTAKTHIAVACGFAFMNKEIPIKYTSSTNMLTTIREDFDISKYTKPKILIIDDLGKEKISEWVLEQLYIIVNFRYVNQLSTIATTEGSLEDLEQKYGEMGRAIISRLTHDFKLIKCIGPDFRNSLVRKNFIECSHSDRN